MVTIKVGKQKQAFFAHKGLICHYSTYFRAAFHGHFQEATAGAVELDDDDVEVFKTFFGWVYTGKLFEPTSKPGEVPLDWSLLSKLYVFGDARGIPALKDAAVDAIIDRFTNVWSMPTYIFPYIYSNTPEGSQLRKLAVNMIVYTTFPSTRLKDPQYEANFPIEYLRDLAIALCDLPGGRSTSTKKQWSTRDRCQYHDHSDITQISGPK